MRNRYHSLRVTSEYLGALCGVMGIVILLPLLLVAMRTDAWPAEVAVWVFAAPSAVALALAGLLKGARPFRPLTSSSSMLLCSLGWIVVSWLGALPLWWGLPGVGFLDAFFESVSGFTTTGITMLQGLDEMPRSILMWRSLIQWVGGLGILTFFLLVVSTSGSAHVLFTAESHKIFSRRPAPGMFHTLRILWTVYAALTGAIALLLVVEGMSVYDAVLHAFTCLSTGGYSPYDASIAHYAQTGYRHYRAIEYTLTMGMALGGMNFFIHYRIATGSFRALWDNLEVRLWWLILAGATGLIMLDHWLHAPPMARAQDVESLVRTSLFQVVSIATTTGFGTEDINTPYFPALSKQIFLILMVIGGCVGSTGGGIKVMRIGVLLKMLGRQVNRIVRGRRVVSLVIVDGEKLEPEELRRISALFFAWMALLALGAGVTALLSSHDAFSSASGMFSALGNIGPCYMSVAQMGELDPLIKVTYIVGMLAGRLEILPLLLLLRPRDWH